jgi:hypothetical protein
MIVRYTGDVRGGVIPGTHTVYVHRWYCGEHGDQGHNVYMRQESVERQLHQRWLDANKEDG